MTIAIRYPFCVCDRPEPALINEGMDSICEVCCEVIRELFYLQTRGHVGNCFLWWKKGRHGYTCDIKQAHIFTREEAFGQAKIRPDVDFPWRKSYIDAHVVLHINSELVSRNDEGAVYSPGSKIP